MKIRFDCLEFSANTNDEGTITISAEIESLTDSRGLLLAIAKSEGAEHARKILEIELAREQSKPDPNRSPSAAELEGFLIPPNKIIETKIPPEAMQLYREGIREQIPRGIGSHLSIGYFVLETSGQGPCMIWCERKS